MLRDLRRRFALWIAPELQPAASDVVVPPNYASLLTLLTLYADHSGQSVGTVARKAGGYFDLPGRLERGCGAGAHRINAMTVWFSDHWPAALPWPSDIPRPFPNQKDPAS